MHGDVAIGHVLQAPETAGHSAGFGEHHPRTFNHGRNSQEERNVEGIVTEGHVLRGTPDHGQFEQALLPLAAPWAGSRGTTLQP